MGVGKISKINATTVIFIVLYKYATCNLRLTVQTKKNQKMKTASNVEEWEAAQILASFTFPCQRFSIRDRLIGMAKKYGKQRTRDSSPNRCPTRSMRSSHSHASSPQIVPGKFIGVRGISKKQKPKWWLCRVLETIDDQIRVRWYKHEGDRVFYCSSTSKDSIIYRDSILVYGLPSSKRMSVTNFNQLNKLLDESISQHG